LYTGKTTSLETRSDGTTEGTTQRETFKINKEFSDKCVRNLEAKLQKQPKVRKNIFSQDIFYEFSSLDTRNDLMVYPLVYKQRKIEVVPKKG